MTESDDKCHASLHGERPPPSSLDQFPGLLFVSMCGAIAVFRICEVQHGALWKSIALFAGPLLGSLNRAWRWLSRQVFRIVGPIIKDIIFSAILTPVAIIMRWAGSDLHGRIG